MPKLTTGDGSQASHRSALELGECMQMVVEDP